MYLLTSVAVPGGTPFSLYASTSAPSTAPVAGPGALCVRNDAGNVGLYINTTGSTWVLIGGAAGPLYPDDVPATFGTTSPAQGQVVYVSGSARFEIKTIAISAAAGAATRPILVSTGARTTTDAAAGTASGAVVVQSGATTQSGAAVGGASGSVDILSGGTSCTVGGGTGGTSGAVKVASGNATATAGTSGSTGTVTASSGDSANGASGLVLLSSGNGSTATGDVTVRSGDAAGAGATSGNVILRTGTAVAGTRGNVIVVAPAIDTTAQATDFSVIGASATALRFVQGATVYLTLNTSTGQADFTRRVTTTDGVTSGTVRVVGGLAFSTTADSNTITGNGGPQTVADQIYTIPANTLKAGSTIRVRGAVRRTGINGVDTAQMLLRLGGTVFVQTIGIAAAAGDRAVFEAEFTARAAPGVGVTVVGNGRAGWTTVGSGQLPTGASVALSTNGPLDLDVQINMPANIANTAVLEQFNVYIY